MKKLRKMYRSEFIENVEDMMNELYPVKIGSLKYRTEEVLKAIDPIVYNQWIEQEKQHCINDGHMNGEWHNDGEGKSFTFWSDEGGLKNG